jgi:hypothetical protein
VERLADVPLGGARAVGRAARRRGFVRLAAVEGHPNRVTLSKDGVASFMLALACSHLRVPPGPEERSVWLSRRWCAIRAHSPPGASTTGRYDHVAIGVLKFVPEKGGQHG